MRRSLALLVALAALPAVAQARPLDAVNVNGAQYRLELAESLQGGQLAFYGHKPGTAPRRVLVPLSSREHEISAVAEVDCEHGGVVLVAGSVGRRMGRIQAKLDDGRRLELTRTPTPLGVIISMLVPSRVGVLYIAAYDDSDRRLGVLRPRAVRPCGDSRPIEPGILDGTLQQQHDAARARWRAAKIADYTFKVDCPRCGRRPPGRVERLFNLIQEDIDRRPGRLVVEYGAHGVPRRFVGDQKSFTVSGFRRR